MDEDSLTARQRLEAQLLDRAMKNKAFREELVRDPKAVFAPALGIEVLEAARSPIHGGRRMCPATCYIQMVYCYLR